MNKWLAYQAFGELLLKGVTPVNAAQLLADKLKMPKMLGIKSLLEQGVSVSKAYRLLDVGLSKTDLVVLETGEYAGRLPQAFVFIAESKRFYANLKAKLVFSLIYPAFLVGIVLFLHPARDLQQLIQNPTRTLVLQKLGLLLGYF